MILAFKVSSCSFLNFTRTSGGDPEFLFSNFCERGILPARAGVILIDCQSDGFHDDFTRTSGGDPSNRDGRIDLGKFYPHERG